MFLRIPLYCSYTVPVSASTQTTPGTRCCQDNCQDLTSFTLAPNYFYHVRQQPSVRFHPTIHFLLLQHHMNILMLVASSSCESIIITTFLLFSMSIIPGFNSQTRLPTAAPRSSPTALSRIKLSGADYLTVSKSQPDKPIYTARHFTDS